MAFGHDAKHTFSFLHDADSGVQALVVHLWSSESKVIFYKGSHLRPLRTMAAANGLLEIPEEALSTSQIEPIEVEMKQGGLYVSPPLGYKSILTHVAQGYC
jgi:hypothetical protein